jgi:hypothetical protein
MKKSKSKKNWFRVQFEKHPYLYTFVIGWPIVFFIFIFIDSLVYVDEILVVIFFAFPLIILFLWFRKNKTKIKPFYKRNKKIFNRVYFYLGSVFSLIPIACIVGIITTGGISNFIERTKFEINAIIITYQEFSYCDSPNTVSYYGYAKDHRIFFFKEQTQYIDYIGDNLETLFTRDLELLNANHCVGTRYLLKEAQKGNQSAKEMLVAYPPELRALYSFPHTGNGKYIFSRYEKNIKDMDLNNPAIAYNYAIQLDDTLTDIYGWKQEKNKKFSIKPDALKYLKQSAEGGYFLAMQDFISIYAHKNYFNKVNCEAYLKYINTLADEKSLIGYYTLMNGYMGKIGSGISRTIYKCLGEKPNFSKAFSMLMNRPTEGSTSTSQLKKSNHFNSSYPAIFYLYGLGGVEQDYAKAYELFNYSEFKFDEGSIPSQAYLAYMNYMAMGTEQNLNKGKGLTIELAKKIPVIKQNEKSPNLILSCGGVDYNFMIPALLTTQYYYQIENYYKLSKNEQIRIRKEHEANVKIDNKVRKEYRDRLGQCILDSEHEVSINFLEKFIYNRMSNLFKNPELIRTLNYLGKVN